jgi:hypothetical protein
MTNSFRARLALSAAAGLTFALSSSRAFADMSKMQCIEVNTKGQDLRREGKLSQARAELRRCLDSSCPRLVRDDCTRRLDELEKAQPTIVFVVKDVQGADVIDVRVSIDGQPLVDHLDGTPLRVDPGAHVFTFEVVGQPPVVDKVLVREGETERHERVVVGSAAPPAAGLPTAAPTAAPEPSATPAVPLPGSGLESPSGGLGTQRLLGLIAGGGGIAGLAAGAVFGLLGSAAWSNAKQACGGNPSVCADAASGRSYHDTASTDATISTIAFVAGGALLAGGAVLFLTGGRESRAPASVWVGPSAGARLAGLVVGGGFQ